MDFRTFEVECETGRKFLVKELDGLEQINADMLVPEEARSDTSVYFRAAMAVTAINGTDLPKVHSRLEMTARLRMFSGRELDELVRKYYVETRPTKGELKNEPAPVAE